MTVTILTVDDSRTMRDMLRLALVDAGFRVVQAEDGLHGLDVLRQEMPQVVITASASSRPSARTSNTAPCRSWC